MRWCWGILGECTAVVMPDLSDPGAPTCFSLLACATQSSLSGAHLLIRVQLHHYSLHREKRQHLNCEIEQIGRLQQDPFVKVIVFVWLVLALMGMKCQKLKEKKVKVSETEMEMVMMGKDGKKYAVTEMRS